MIFKWGDYCFVSMEQKFAEDIVNWQYDEAFSLYNYTPQERTHGIEALLNPALNYYAILDPNQQLLGFRCFGHEAQVSGGDYPMGPLDTGGGLRPELTGQGHGLPVIQAGLELGKHLFSPSAFRVTVAEFNTRAIQVCERAGYRQIGRFQRPLDGLPFIQMLLPRFSFETFQEKHFSDLVRWLKAPHVQEFWEEPEDENELKRKYLKELPQEREVSPKVILFFGRRIGYIQSYEACRIGRGWWPGFKSGIFGIDQFIGEGDLVNRGLGTQAVTQFIQELSHDPRVFEIIVDPDPENLRAIRMYQKIGFVSEGLMTTPNGQATLMRLKLKG